MDIGRLTQNDVLLDDGALLGLGFDRFFTNDDEKNLDIVNGVDISERAHLDVDRAIAALSADPALAARLIGFAPVGTNILWNGEYASSRLGKGTIGVKVIEKRTGAEVVGDNVFGQFLEDVRDGYLKVLARNQYNEVPVREGQIVVDFTRKGAFESDIERKEFEDEGNRFIHVDVYRPQVWRRDSGLDGTSGHAERVTANAVSFQKFECPFGVSSPAPIIVGSEAEASFLYEKALLGELDWNALLDSVVERGLMNATAFAGRKRETMVNEYSAQFKWMREKIVMDNEELKKLPVVAHSMLVSDNSFGCAVFNPDTAPSPAHVLAHYINNPVLLFNAAPVMNYVHRCLNENDRKDPVRFVLGSDEPDNINIAVIGSDTIGGREPGRRTTSKLVTKRSLGADGRKVFSKETRHVIPFKEKDAIEADYAAFSARMDSVLAGIPKGSTVRLVTGNSSLYTDTVGVGTPQMVERYVLERSGQASRLDYATGEVVPRKLVKPEKTVDSDVKLESIQMEHFYEVLPVLAGKFQSVSIPIDGGESQLEFKNNFLGLDCAMCYSVKADRNNSHVLSLASLVAGEGLPVIHVQENATQERQKEAMKAAVVLMREELSGAAVETDSLFVGGDREDWDLQDGAVLSLFRAEGHVMPIVFRQYDAAVSVAGYGFRSVFGTYAALVADELGVGDSNTFKNLRAAEANMESLYKSYLDLVPDPSVLDDETQERLLRQAVRLMSGADAGFRDVLLKSGDGDVILPAVMDDPTGLFVNLDGMGRNRFGVVFAAERNRLKDIIEARVAEEKAAAMRVLEESSRRQRLAAQTRAEGQKVASGLPKNPDAAEDAVWFIGTNTPAELQLPDEKHSFEMWDDMGGADPLVREKVARPWISDGAGGRVDNEYVYLFPSDLAAVTGQRRVIDKADSRDLTGVTRVMPETGEEACVAYGVPVRFNNKGNELGNVNGYTCSYRLDNDSSNYAESLVLADSLARGTALRYGLSLCLPGRTRFNGTPYYTLPQVFMEKAYDRNTRKWTDNPHRAPLNQSLTERYISLLERGKNYPLNVIPLPSESYGEDDKVLGNEGRKISAEGKFISELLLALRVANAAAVSMGVPLRFPLDAEGRIDLGPGVPERFRALAERRIDSFIGVVRKEELISGTLPDLDRIQMYQAARHRDYLSRSGTEVYLRPNDLVRAFGQYDFSTVMSGQTAPLHEMAFRIADGTVFTLTDAKSTRGMDNASINAYLSYSKNDERRFVIRSTDDSKVPEFVSVLKSYISRASAVKVESRLVSVADVVEQEKKNINDRENGSRSLKGYVNLLSSNSTGYVYSDHDIGHEMTAFNGASRFEGTDAEQVYYGHRDAGDSFSGYAEVRLVMPDGSRTPWTEVQDLELAKDIVMSSVGRVYRGDERIVPSAAALDLLMTAYAVKESGEIFRTMSFRPEEKVEDDKVVNLGQNNSGGIPEEKPSQNVFEEKSEDAGIRFTVSKGTYKTRTLENAQASDVDFTLAFAADFLTAGEKATALAAGDSLIRVELPLVKTGLSLSAKAVNSAVSGILSSLPDEYLAGEPMGLNIAGNGIHTLVKNGVSQKQADEFVTKVIDGLRSRGVVVSSIRSGGQTGIDEAGAVAGVVLGIPTTVHAPKDWLYRTEDNKDVIGNEKSFRERFTGKDYASLKGKIVPPQEKTVGKSMNLPI